MIAEDLISGCATGPPLKVDRSTRIQEVSDASRIGSAAGPAWRFRCSNLIHPAAGDERTTPGVQDETQEHRQPITPRGASKIPLTVAPLLSQTSRDYKFPKRASPPPPPASPQQRSGKRRNVRRERERRFIARSIRKITGPLGEASAPLTLLAISRVPVT